MAKKPAPPGLAEAALKARSSVPESSLEQVREALRVMRDRAARISDLKEQLTAEEKAQEKQRHEELPELFERVGIDKLGLPAEGNLPAYDSKLRPYYKASISAEWPLEKQLEAFSWLDKNGHGDLVRDTFVIALPREATKAAEWLQKTLEENEFEYERKRAVSWNTLTAFVKEQVEVHETVPPLDLLGAKVGKIVELKERKEK